MATVVDSLIVTLGLDPSNFTKGQREAAQAFLNMKNQAARGSKEIESASKKMLDGLSQVRNQALLLFAAFTGGRGLAQFVSDLTRGDTALGRNAQFLATSAQRLNEWQGMARLTGGSAASITGSLQQLNQSLLAMRYTGDTSLLPALRALKQAAPEVDLSFLEMNGRMLKSHELIDKLRGAFRGLDKDTALFIGSQMKLSEDLVYILTLPENEYKRYQADLARLSKVTDEDIKATRERVRAQGLLEQSFDSLGRSVLTQATPAMVMWTESLIKATEWAQKNPKIVSEMAASFAVLSTVVAGITFAPLLLSLTRVVALAGAAVATVKFLEQYKKDQAAGWVPGTLPPDAKAERDKYNQGVNDRRAAARHDRRIHGRGTLMDTAIYGYYGYSKTIQEDEEAYNRLYGPGSANQSELGMFGPARPTARNQGDTRKAFIEKYRGVAEEISRQTGVPVERILAQAGLESGWRTDAPANNLFGIKASGDWQGRTANLATTEDYGQGPVATRQNFRAYDDPTDSFRDWAKVLQQNNFRGALQPGLSDEEYARRLKEGGYATDSQYAGKLTNVIRQTRALLQAGGSSSISSPAASLPTSAVTTGDSRSVTIGTMNINTQATDAQGIAKDIKPELDKTLLAGQAQYGLR